MREALGRPPLPVDLWSRTDAQPLSAFRAAYGGIDAATWARGRFTAAWHTCVTLEYSLETGNADLHHEGRVALQHLAGG